MLSHSFSQFAPTPNTTWNLAVGTGQKATNLSLIHI